MEEKRPDLVEAQKQANAMLDRKLAEVISPQRVKQIFEVLEISRAVIAPQYRNEYLADPKSVVQRYEAGDLSILMFPALDKNMSMREALGNLWIDRNGVYLENLDTLQETVQVSPVRLQDFMSKTAKADITREQNILNVLLAVDDLARNGKRPKSAAIKNGIAALQSLAKEYKVMDAYYTQKAEQSADKDYMESLQQSESATDAQILADIHLQAASAISKIAKTLGIDVRQPRK